MALVTCPKCGNAVSEKAAKCPHCGIDVQKALDEVRKEQKLTKKKHRKYVLISIAFVFILVTVGFIAYLYSINAKHKQLLKIVRDEYIKQINSSDAEYFLFDIDKNGVPELWLKTGQCEAEYQLLVYTFDDGIRLIYDDNASHSTFYQRDDYIIKLYAHMGDAFWDKLTFNGNNIIATRIYHEDVSNTDRDYRNPDEICIELYSSSNKKPIMDAFLIGLK